MTSPVSWVRNGRGDTNWEVKTQYYYQGRAYKPVEFHTKSDIGFDIHLSDFDPNQSSWSASQIHMKLMAEQPG